MKSENRGQRKQGRGDETTEEEGRRGRRAALGDSYPSWEKITGNAVRIVSMFYSLGIIGLIKRNETLGDEFSSTLSIEHRVRGHDCDKKLVFDVG